MFLTPLLIVGALVAYVIYVQRNLVKLNNQSKEAWSDIDVQLKRRYNLIPNLVETVKGYATHESDVLTKVTEARAKAINAGSMKDHAAAENMLNNALKSLFAVAENYPALKANENFMQLQNELVDTEDKIQSARRFHNSVVRDMNIMIEQFPSNLVANLFSFKQHEFFEVEEAAEREVVKVSFDKKEEKPVEAPKAEASKAQAQAALPLETPEKK